MSLVLKMFPSLVTWFGYVLYLQSDFRVAILTWLVRGDIAHCRKGCSCYSAENTGHGVCSALLMYLVQPKLREL